MKNIFFVLLSLVSISVYSQKQDTLFISKLMDNDWKADFPAQTKFKFIKFEDGSVLALGDKTRYVTPSGTNQSASTQASLLSSSSNRTNNFPYLMNDKMVLDLAFALQYVENLIPKTTMTSEQALSELKKAKEKLDLGEITQKEYNELKAKLNPIILKN